MASRPLLVFGTSERSFSTDLETSCTNWSAPALGGGFLLLMFFITAYGSLDPDYGSGSSIFGVGSVFVLGMGILVLGLAIMLFTRLAHPAFFKGETLKKITSDTDTQDPLVS